MILISDHGSHTFNEKNPRTFHDCQNVFPRSSWSLPTFKFKVKQQLLTVYTECNPMHINTL